MRGSGRRRLLSWGISFFFFIYIYLSLRPNGEKKGAEERAGEGLVTLNSTNIIDEVSPKFNPLLVRGLTKTDTHPGVTKSVGKLRETWDIRAMSPS